MPDQVGEEMILRGCATMSRKRIFSSSFGAREMRVIAAGHLAERLPRLHRDLAVGFRRQAQDRLDGVDVGLELGLPEPRRRTVPFSARRNSTSWPVFQPMPLPPLPSFSSSGPIEVKRAYRFG